MRDRGKQEGRRREKAEIQRGLARRNSGWLLKYGGGGLGRRQSDAASAAWSSQRAPCGGMSAAATKLRGLLGSTATASSFAPCGCGEN